MIFRSMLAAQGNTVITPIPFLTYTHTWNGNAQIQSNEADFDGTGDYISITPTTVINDMFVGSVDFTIEFNISQDIADGTILSIGNGGAGWPGSGTTNGHMFLLYQSGGTLYFQWDNSGPKNINANSTLTGAEKSVIVVRDSGRISLYVDGSRIATTTTSTDILDDATTGTKVIYLGEIPSGGLEWDGQINETRLSNTARYDATDTTITPLSLTNDANTKYLNTFIGANGSTPTLNTE